MDFFTVLIFLILLVFVGYSVYWHFFQFEYHKAALADFATPCGMHFEDLGSRSRLWGRVDNLEVEVTSRIVGAGKNRRIESDGVLKLVDAPKGLVLRHEGIGTGMERMAGHREYTVGDLDFDNAFWVVADDPVELAEYLTDERRDGFLHWLPRLGAEVLDRKVEVSTIEFGMGVSSASIQLARNLVALATALSPLTPSMDDTSRPPAGFVATRKMRSMALMLAIVGAAFWLLPLEVHMPPWLLAIDESMGVVALLAALTAFSGWRRTALVLTGLVGSATCLASASLSGLMYLGDEPLLAAFGLCVTLVLIFLLGGACFHLNALRTVCQNSLRAPA